MLNVAQARKFAVRFNLTDLRQIEGEWYADDDGHPYHISEEAYCNAQYEGDLD